MQKLWTLLIALAFGLTASIATAEEPLVAPLGDQLANPVTESANTTSPRMTVLPKIGGWGAAIAQSCPDPDPGEGLCGYFDGYCRYCNTSYPHYCSNTNKCYQYFTQAQEACGNNYVICAAPQ